MLDDPIVIVVHGTDVSTYSLIVQSVTNDTSEYSFITLSEDVEFKIKLAANKFEIF